MKQYMENPLEDIFGLFEEEPPKDIFELAKYLKDLKDDNNE